MIKRLKNAIFNVSLKVKLMVIFIGMIMVPLVIFSSWVNYIINTEFTAFALLTGQQHSVEIAEEMDQFNYDFTARLFSNTLAY